MTLEEAAYIVAPDAQQILAKQKTYVVAYRYEGLIEVKASSVSEARDGLGPVVRTIVLYLTPQSKNTL